MNSSIHNATKGLAQAILIFTDEQRRSATFCQYIYCKFSIDDQDDANATCHVTSERLPLPDGSLISENLPFSTIARYITLYIYPLFIFMGIFGNSLSCWIMFLNVRRNGYTANFYLTLLAFVDCLYLLGSAFPYWISHIHSKLDIRLLSDFFCRFVYWFGNFTTHLSAGLMVSVTVERFIAIKYPFNAHQHHTVRNTHLVLIFLLTFFFLLDSRVFVLVKHFNENIYIIFTCPNQTYIQYERRDILHCGIDYHINEQTWILIDFAVYPIIPFLIIVTLNSLIIHQLIGAQRLRQSMSHYNNKPLNLHRNFSDITGEDIRRAQRLRRSHSVPTRVSSGAVLQPLTRQNHLRSNIKQSNASSLEMETRYQTSFIRRRSHSNNIRLTILLLFISGSFLALTLPAVVLNLIMSKKFHTRPTTLETYLNPTEENFHSDAILYYTITRLLIIINHSINFILYFVVGKRFRRDLKVLCGRSCRNFDRQTR